MYFNEEVLVSDSFGQESIRRFSKFFTTSINEKKPSYYSFDFQTTQLEDETDLVQFGNSDEAYFNSPIQKKETDFIIFDSGWKDFPSHYKYFSMDLGISPDVPKIRRKTDSLLDWLGDWGGLLDSLYFLADILLSPLSAYMMNSKLAQLLVRILPSE